MLPNDSSDTYYSRSLPDACASAYPILEDRVDAQVCVIGGGLAGLATALGLAQRGVKTVLLEANKIAFGASGRNGGFCLAHYAASPESILEKTGKDHTHALHALLQDAQKLIRNRIQEHDIPCSPVDGFVEASWHDNPDDMKRKQAFLSDVLSEKTEFWPIEKTRELYLTKRYHESLFYPHDFHMDPLRYALGVAAAFCEKGGLIFESSEMLGMTEDSAKKTIRTAKGSVYADHVVYCGSAYAKNLDTRLLRATLKIATYVMVTQPMTQKTMESAIRAPYAIYDTRFADDYYRPLPDGRLLWGGRVAWNKTPAHLESVMYGDMLKVYPQLAAVRADYAWSGLMGYSAHKMPLIGQFSPGIWYCTNFGGSGVCATTAGGETIAKAIAQNDETYRLFEPFSAVWTGGPLGTLAARAVYYGWRMSDWTGSGVVKL